MNNVSLLTFIRGLGDSLHGADEVSDFVLDTLEEIQDSMDAKYADYEDRPAPSGAETIRDLMMEAIKLIHDGVEEFLLFSEDFRDRRLSRGVSLVEEGHDIMEAINYTIASDSSWTSSASVK